MLFAMGMHVANTTPPPPFERLDTPHLQMHVEGQLTGGLRQASDARHLGDVGAEFVKTTFFVGVSQSEDDGRVLVRQVL